MQMKFAPCSYCHRKPGFFSDNKNYCWLHWYEKKCSPSLIMLGIVVGLSMPYAVCTLLLEPTLF
jgi:hypothetical protein